MLYIIATPIGNMEDISLRALRLLGEVDFVICEDTRVTRNLLNNYEINTPTISYHQHSNEDRVSEILNFLKNGKKLAFVSDAGTPGISDPGGKLVARVIELSSEIGEGDGDERFEIESIPGPSAVTAALAISGLPTDKFVFMGFPPHKKGRQTFVNRVLDSDYPVVVYESKHRIIKFLEELGLIQNHRLEAEKLLKDRKKIITKEITSVVVCRELTKMHETTYRGELENIITRIKSDPNAQKGEFVVIIGK